MSNDSAVGYIDFTIPPINNKIVRVTLLALILLIGIITNVFIIIYTFCHPRSLRKSSIIFLLGSSFVNVAALIFIIPVQITTISAEEWVFGSTTEEKELACIISSCFTGIPVRATIYSLATISVDRFLFLVKPLVYKRYIKPVTSAIAMVAILLCLGAYQVVAVSFDEAEFNLGIPLCIISIQSAHPILIAVGIIVIVAPVIVIAVTTVWTFISTHQFIRNDHQQRVDAIGTQEEAVEIENDLYTRRIKNLFGIFSLLLISQIISVLPISIAIASRAAGYNDKLPSWYLFSAGAFWYFGCITNPAIQCYFRKDLTDTIKEVYTKLSTQLQCISRSH